MASSPTMTKKPPKKQSNGFPSTWKRAPFWLRCSDQHPMVQSYPGEIVEKTNHTFEVLRNLRSPSPDERGFSRFSSRPASPDTQVVVPGSSSQFPPYFFPPPQPPHFHLPPTLASPTRQHADGSLSKQLQQLFPSPPTSSSSRDQRGAIVPIEFQINSDMIGVQTTTNICSWDTGKSFPEFWEEMCKKMGLDQTTAVLGYKFSGDRAKESPRQLSSTEDYQLAMGEIRRKVRNARTKEHRLILHNLVSSLPFHFPF
jgi:hypothetical protein